MEHAGSAKRKKEVVPQGALDSLVRLNKETKEVMKGSKDAIQKSMDMRVQIARTIARIENIELEGEDARLAVELKHIIDVLEKGGAPSHEAAKLTADFEAKAARKAHIKEIIDAHMDEAEARARGK